MSRSRWMQLLLGLLCMIVISSPQYVWTLFTQPLMASLRRQLAAIQITFSILIVVQTFLSPFQGVLVDRFGPRLLLSVGGVITGLSWVLAAQVTTLTGLYLTYGLLGGIGTGIVYVGVIGHMVQWFPDRRGFATGHRRGRLRHGRAADDISDRRVDEARRPISRRCLAWAWSSASSVCLPRKDCGVPLRHGRRSGGHGARLATAQAINYRPAEMLRTPIFWLMFAMMTMMSTAGLMVTSQMGAFTRDFGMASALVFGLPLLPLALSLDRITNGLHAAVLRLAVRSDRP